ncbi:MAG: pseudouridine synthase [Candidatus Portnoybacteria bacterium]|nr:pseudouridine synthase [Candidatus Portnoybacteria bacterium]
MRLQRFIALSSELSRRAAEAAIARGEVSVNGAAVAGKGTTVDPSRDRVELAGKLLQIPQGRTYIAFFKPHNTMVTKSDPEGRPLLWDLIPEWKGKLNSVGRLDFDSEGLIILTDDGDFLNILTHPKHEIWKTYRVRVKGEPAPHDLDALKNGVPLSDGAALPARVRRIDKGDGNALMEISIREGRNRQVRRMFDAIGYPVIRLRRIAVGLVRLGRLTPGKWRHLTHDEVQGLMSVL